MTRTVRVPKPEPEPAVVHRIVSTPAALDRARWPDGWLIARLAPDEVLVIGPVPPGSDDANVAEGPCRSDDPHALVAWDRSLVVSVLSAERMREIRDRVPWTVPEGPGFAQGVVLGVPVKVLVRDDGSGLLLTSNAFAQELRERLV
jgi:hypothetical protein